MALTGMQAGDLYNLVGQAQQLGVYDVVLPFLLVFTLVFAILEKIQILGAGKKNLNIIVALILALLFLQNSYLIFLLQRFLPNISLFLIIFLTFLLMFGIFGKGEFKGMSGLALTVAFFVSLIAVIIAISTDLMPYGFMSTLLDFYYSINPGTRMLVWVILIFAIIIVFVTHEKKPEGSGFGKKLRELAESAGFH